jgi:hypothetical protein
MYVYIDMFACFWCCPQVSQEAKDFIKRCLSRVEQRPDVLSLYVVELFDRHFDESSDSVDFRYADPYVRNKTREAPSASDAK